MSDTIRQYLTIRGDDLSDGARAVLEAGDPIDDATLAELKRVGERVQDPEAHLAEAGVEGWYLDEDGHSYYVPADSELHRDAGYGPDRVWLDGDTLAWADEDERQAMGDVDDWQIEELEEGLDLSRGQIQIGTREYLTAADMMRPQRRDDGGITLHDDGTVSYWSVYERHWRRDRAGAISHRDLAAMSEDERTRIRQHAARATES